ncbi:unnamed protein product [Ilex paraguariensis]|uniref:Uncharacterized protein n=1 Tax=Ilex paraguariensis TaxID=185542 RepID=A0ABC8TPY8_9AQUA
MLPWLPKIPMTRIRKPISPPVVSSPSFSVCSSFSLCDRPLRYAVLGAGIAGLSVVWHLLQHSIKDLWIDIYNEVGIGGGASGGLLHPYSPNGSSLLFLYLRAMLTVG